MRLADLLAEATTEDLERMAHEHARADAPLARHELLDTIEGVLRSHRFLQEFLLNRQPPTFATMALLLDAEGHALPNSGLRDSVLAETARFCAALDSGQVLAREDQLRVYRRVLYQARSNDSLIDPAEASILAVLRQELGIAQVEHFLIEHHADLREFWQQEEAFMRELHELRSAGLVYVREGTTYLPEDLAPVVRNVLGIDMPRPSARRLFGYLSNTELHDALAATGAPSSGSKEERVDRLVAHMTQPKTVLRMRTTSLERLRDICRDVGARISGSKDELVERLIAHVASGRDLVSDSEPPPPPVNEPRVLDEHSFACLFARLRGLELQAILGEFELRRSGTKETIVSTLWDAHRSEETLLSTLSNGELEAILKRIGVKSAGSKGERIRRLIEHFQDSPSSASPNFEPNSLRGGVVQIVGSSPTLPTPDEAGTISDDSGA